MHIAQGDYCQRTLMLSPTWKVLIPVGRGIESVVYGVHSLSVFWFIDNQNVVCILQVGSAKTLEALRVFWACIHYNIWLEPEWISSDKNQLANYVVLWITHNPSVFGFVGPYLVDRIASS